MKKIRLITYLIFFAFHLGFLLVAFLIDSVAPKEAIDPDNIADLLQLVPLSKYVNYIFIVKWVAIIGISLVIVDFIVDIYERNRYKSEATSLRNELNAVKAQLFDMQKTSTSAATTPATGDTSDNLEVTKED